MAAKTATIVLDGNEYTVHAFNLGELEELAEIFEGPTSRAPYKILRLAWKRVEGAPDINQMAPTMDEMGEAVKTILRLAGLRADPPKPPDLKVVPVAS